jgi:hypothetical protein
MRKGTSRRRATFGIFLVGSPRDCMPVHVPCSAPEVVSQCRPGRQIRIGRRVQLDLMSETGPPSSVALAQLRLNEDDAIDYNLRSGIVRATGTVASSTLRRWHCDLFPEFSPRNGMQTIYQ